MKKRGNRNNNFDCNHLFLRVNPDTISKLGGQKPEKGMCISCHKTYAIDAKYEEKPLNSYYFALKKQYYNRTSRALLEKVRDQAIKDNWKSKKRKLNIDTPFWTSRK